jgi:tRNA A-37 threonylcarbamoyl transferase component Bud32
VIVAPTPLPARLGRYEVEHRLAQGGMAELFVARLEGVEGFAKRVVVKRVLPELARERGFVDMFLYEARLAATLDHQNIVAVHDIGRDDQDQFFFAMDLLHGADLASLLRSQAELPLELVVELVRGACAGLHYAHERHDADGAALGLVHRDISPHNLFVTFDGCVKLLDFGIAKAVDKIADRATRTGTLRGKVPYMSPEQCRGEPLDRRSDIFSLGIVLWELVSGERLFGARGESDFEVFKQIAEREAPSVRRADCPEALLQIVTKALARDRAQRYQTMAELHDALDGLDLAMAARAVGAFVIARFPERAESWRRGDHAVSIPPAARATVEIQATAPTQSGPSPPIARRAVVAPTRRRGLALAAIVALTIGGGAFLAGRRANAPHAADTPIAAAATPIARQTEDAHWFQTDDYLVAREPYAGGRLGGVRVAKLLAAADHPGGSAKFLDGNSNEITTAAYWKSHVARPAELVIGALAFCRVDSWQLAASPPIDKDDARTHDWALARVTEIAELGKERVRVGDVTCDVAGVRVPE